jgi:hypothetical protein
MPELVTEVASREDLVAALGPTDAKACSLILIGGADAMPEADRARLTDLFVLLVDHLERTRTALVDGGTDSGVMRLIGTIRLRRAATFRLVGVLPSGALGRTTRDGAPITIAPGHPEIILVPGTHFGDETEWLFATADHLGPRSAVTLIVNGGRLARAEALQRLENGHRVVAVQDSGRAADELAGDEDLRASGRLHVIPLTTDAAGLAAALEGSQAT